MLKSLLILTLFRVAFVGDPQADNATQVYYAQRSVFRELRERKDIDLVVVLGDLVNDEPELIGPMAASLDSLACPWVAVPGNHDRDVYKGEKGRARDVATWRREVGYVDTAFVLGGIRFILMNDVRTKGTADYEAGLSAGQKAWLAARLAATPPSQLAVIATHIPLTEMHARDSLEALLSGHRLLLVSGHTHQVRRETLTLGGGHLSPGSLTLGSQLALSHAAAGASGEPAVESLVAGASCGSWWRGFKDALGIPDALMNCGSPRGYFVADFSAPDARDGSVSYRLRWHTLTAGRGPVRSSQRLSGSSHTGRRISFSDSQASVTATDSTLIVNVFGGHLDGTVKIKGIDRAQSSGRWLTLVRRHLIAPEVEERIAFNSSMTREYRKEHQEEYIPMRRLASPHVWAADVPDAASLRGRKVTVIYSDGHMSFRTRLTVR